MEQPLVLASGSRIRAALLDQVGLRFDRVPANVDERAIARSLDESGPGRTADALAAAKAQAVSTERPGAWVIGADQVAIFEGRMMWKATSMAEAVDRLTALSGGSHSLISAAVLARDGEVDWRVSETVEVRMRAYGAEEAAAEIAALGVRACDSVTCYELEGRAPRLIEAVRGDYFSALGLPLFQLLGALRARKMLP